MLDEGSGPAQPIAFISSPSQSLRSLAPSGAHEGAHHRGRECTERRMATFTSADIVEVNNRSTCCLSLHGETNSVRKGWRSSHSDYRLRPLQPVIWCPKIICAASSTCRRVLTVSQSWVCGQA